MDELRARSQEFVEEPGSAIRGSRMAFVSALRRGDARSAAEAYALDATLIAPAVDVLHGRSAIEDFWRTGVETGVMDVTFETIEVQSEGNVAVEVGRYTLHVVPERGATVVDRGRYLMVHRVDSDGQWRRSAEMFSPDEVALAAPR